MRRILLTTLAFSAVAGVAVAAPPTTDGEAVAQKKIALEAVRLTTSGAAMSYARGAATRIPGVAQTSITRVARSGGASFDAGLLCGLMPHPDAYGAASAFSHDPDGKFVGAKLRLSF